MSCLFQSISELVGEPHQTVRKKVCDFMQDSSDVVHEDAKLKDWIKWQGSTPRKYIRQMRKPSVWGGAMEIACITYIYNVSVKVYRNNTLIAHFVNKNDGESCLELNWTGNHYTARQRT
jgi:hypothetical protein